MPCIVDTDIGGDIDDTWAVALAIANSELDLRMVMVSTGDAAYRARIVAGMLCKAGRTDVAIVLGDDTPWHQDHWLAEWDGCVDLSDYPGRVYEDPAEAMIDLAESTEQDIQLVTLCANTTIGRVLDAHPALAGRLSVVAMLGAVNIDYGGPDPENAELNARVDAEANQKVLARVKEYTLIPVDVCGDIRLKGDLYRRIFTSESVLARMVIDSYVLWQRMTGNKVDPEQHSSILFDTVAVYHACGRQGLEIQEHGLTITDQGFTRIDPQGRSVRMALAWADKPDLEPWIESSLCQ